MPYDDYGEYYEDNPPDDEAQVPPPPGTANPTTTNTNPFDMSGNTEREKAIRDLYKKYGGRTNVPNDEIYGWWSNGLDPWTIEKRIGEEWVRTGSQNYAQQTTAPPGAGGADGDPVPVPPTPPPTPPPSGTVPPLPSFGYDATKWNNTSHTTPKYVAGRMIASGQAGRGNLGPVVAALGAGWSVTGEDTIRDPEGREWDIIQALTDQPIWIEAGGAEGDANAPINSAAGNGFTNTSGAPSGQSSLNPSAGTGMPSLAQLLTAPNTVLPSSITGASSSLTSQAPQIDINALLSKPLASGITPGPSQDLYNTLLGRSQQGLDVDANDPIIKGQTDAFRASQTRDMRDHLGSIAEQQGPYGNMDFERRAANENLGQNVSQFQAELMGRELSARRDEIQNALSQMGQLLSDQQRLALQKELSSIDGQLRLMAINNQSSQFGQDLGFRYANLATQDKQFNQDLQLRQIALAVNNGQFDRRLALDYIQTMIQNDQFGRQLSTQDRQFYADLILRQFQAQANASFQQGSLANDRTQLGQNADRLQFDIDSYYGG